MNLTQALQPAVDSLIAFTTQYPLIGQWYIAVVRFAFPLLALGILLTAIRSLLRVHSEPEIWAYLSLPNGERVPLTHWENIIGRAKSADVQLHYPSISRNHAALIRADDGTWTLHDLGSTGGTLVGELPVDGAAIVEDGDSISLGGVPVVLLPVPEEEKHWNWENRKAADHPASMWGSLFLLTLFQILTGIELLLAKGEALTAAVPTTFVGLIAVEWGYFFLLRILRRTGFEMETIAFFLCTLSLAVTASSAPDALPKQFSAMLLGVGLFLILGWFLRDLRRAVAVRPLAVILAGLLFGATLVFGSAKFGARNWISFGSFSFQPSELVKIAFVWAGAATLDRLFARRNITLFILFTGFCLGCLALMSDFGTAAIFFITFLVIAYLRSGDFATLSLICGGSVFAGMIILKFKPYIANRFAVWGHAWQFASTTGFQQTRTMSAAASGGLVGMGAGRGWLHNVAAADTDLVFGMLCEEWGLIIAALAVLCIITLAIFAVRACRAGRSSFYTIAACAATSLLVFQTILNVFGSVDLLPLTGVTLPFVSNGGSSMLSAWGLLAFLKATDTRQNASFAIRLPSRREMREAADLAGDWTDEEVQDEEN